MYLSINIIRARRNILPQFVFPFGVLIKKLKVKHSFNKINELDFNINIHYLYMYLI